MILKSRHRTDTMIVNHFGCSVLPRPSGSLINQRVDLSPRKRCWKIPDTPSGAIAKAIGWHWIVGRWVTVYTPTKQHPLPTVTTTLCQCTFN